ncbi:MAG TPA: hypothetical protein VFP89_08965 [Propionibacteriaceae bacterium]|nr:hypothetical protein [Propionibacteriaceae bacterium]
MERLAGEGMFTLRLGLSAVPADLEDVADEIGDRLDAYRPQLSEAAAGLELSLTVVAADLWVAVLLAMAAVTGVGYPVARLDAGPLHQTAEQSSPDHRTGREAHGSTR